MDNIINGFLSLPLFLRVSISLFFIFSLLGYVLGRKILWIASFIPYLLHKAFRYLYLFVELPVSMLHKKFGSAFYSIDDRMSFFGKKIDSTMLSWYNTLHNPKKASIRRFALVYVLFFAYISIPQLIGLQGNGFLSGQNMYLYSENAIIKWCEQRGWYNKAVPASISLPNTELSQPEMEYKPLNLVLIVSDTSVSLKIRDIPSSKSGKILDQVYTSETVLWNGELAFGDGDYGNLEPWARIKTKSGVEGWAKFYYLYPENYNDFDFLVMSRDKSIYNSVSDI